MISIDGDNFATGFMVNPEKNKNNVKLKMSTDDGQKDIAVLSASCRPSHFINLAVAMKRRGDERYVDGELRTLATRLTQQNASVAPQNFMACSCGSISRTLQNYAELYYDTLCVPETYSEEEILALSGLLPESWKKLSGTIQNPSRTIQTLSWTFPERMQDIVHLTRNLSATCANLSVFF